VDCSVPQITATGFVTIADTNCGNGSVSVTFF
jgi:hypothetical protein